MSEISTTHLQRCIDTLQHSLNFLDTADEGSIEYEMYHNSLVKSIIDGK
jgi:hypothetical protein